MALIDNLVSYHKLDENAANTTVADAHGANTGTASTNTSNLSTTGLINTAFNFNGSSEYVGLGTMGSLGSNMINGISISMWIKTTDTSLQALYGTLQINEDYRILINRDPTSEALSTGKITIFMRGNVHLRGGVDINTGITDGNWHHLFVVADPNNAGSTRLLIWIDGVSQTIAYQSGGNNRITSFDNFAHPFLIGAWNNEGTPAHHFGGDIDEVGIWNKVMNGTDASDLYNTGSGLSYPFSAATTRLIKISGTFVEKPILTKVAGTFVDKPIKIKVGGTFQDA